MQRCRVQRVGAIARLRKEGGQEVDDAGRGRRQPAACSFCILLVSCANPPCRTVAPAGCGPRCSVASHPLKMLRRQLRTWDVKLVGQTAGRLLCTVRSCLLYSFNLKRRSFLPDCQTDRASKVDME